MSITQRVADTIRRGLTQRFGLFSLLQVLSLTLCAQKRIEIPIYQNGDTSLWYQWRAADVHRMNGADMISSQDSFCLRFWFENAVIQVSSSDGNVLGHLTYFTNRDNETSTKPYDGKHYYSRQDLAAAQCDSVIVLFKKLGIENLPPQDSIKGWGSGEDGEVFVIEASTPGTYFFRDYWTPSAFPGIVEAQALQGFANRLESLFHLEAGFGAFIESLPKGCYREGEMMIRCTGRR